MIMTSNNVIVSIKLCRLDVGNDGCNFGGRGFEVREEETS